MSNKFVFLDVVKVYDEEIFTRERAADWKKHIKSAYDCIFHGLKDKIDDSTQVRFFACKSLIDEVIIDAIIGMRKITDSQYTQTENPNSFKIIAYLTYWWLRHKPASIHYRKDLCLENIKLKPSEALDALSEEERELERQKVIWQLKHINELVAVQMSLSYIFDYDKVVCNNRDCNRLKRKEKDNFCFDSFEEMQEVIVKKLTYYFCYRTIAPKVIEHMLEGYTFHPVWGLTGSQWSSSKNEGTAP